MSASNPEKKLNLTVCFGTSCFLRGAQNLYTELMAYVKARSIEEDTEFKVSFCNEQCTKGPVLTVNGLVLDRCTVEMATQEIEKII